MQWIITDNCDIKLHVFVWLFCVEEIGCHFSPIRRMCFFASLYNRQRFPILGHCQLYKCTQHVVL